MIRILAQTLYGLSAALYLTVAATVLLYRTPLLPESIRTFILEVAEGNLNSVHLIQEQGTLLVFLGLITLWFMFHYRQSRPFHWAMTTYWGLLALIHVFDVRGTDPSVIGPLINSTPFAVYLAVGLLRFFERPETTADRSPAAPH